jgi:hypothetical protein
MKKYTDIKKDIEIKGSDIYDSIRSLGNAISSIKTIKEELSKINDIDLTELEEGWNLIDRYYGNAVRGEIFKRKNKKYIPNTSAVFPKKGDS